MKAPSSDVCVCGKSPTPLRCGPEYTGGRGRVQSAPSPPAGAARRAPSGRVRLCPGSGGAGPPPPRSPREHRHARAGHSLPSPLAWLRSASESTCSSTCSELCTASSATAAAAASSSSSAELLLSSAGSSFSSAVRSSPNQLPRPRNMAQERRRPRSAVNGHSQHTQTGEPLRTRKRGQPTPSAYAASACRQRGRCSTLPLAPPQGVGRRRGRDAGARGGQSVPPPAAEGGAGGQARAAAGGHLSRGTPCRRAPAGAVCGIIPPRRGGGGPSSWAVYLRFRARGVGGEAVRGAAARLRLPQGSAACSPGVRRGLATPGGAAAGVGGQQAYLIFALGLLAGVSAFKTEKAARGGVSCRLAACGLS